MSKKFFLLLVLTVATSSNQTFTMENDILADVIKDNPKNSSILSETFNSLSNWVGFGQKKQTTITNKSTKTAKQKKEKAIESKFFPTQPREMSLKNIDAEKIEIKKEEKKEWCGTKVEQIRNRAKTLFGISFDKKELMYFGASAVALITLGGIVYVLYKNRDKNNNWKFNWTFEKVSQDMQQFVGKHKTAIKSSIITAVIVGIIALCAKRQGISFESVYSRATNLFTKQSTTTKSIENSLK